MEIGPIRREKIWEIVGYEPHEKQKLYHASPARFKVPACGRRFGKSRMEAMDKIDALFSFKKALWWMVAETYGTCDEFAYAKEAIEVLCREFRIPLKDLRMADNERTGEMYIEMPWGDKLKVKSAAHPKSLVGKGLYCVTFSEAAKIERYIWDQLVSPALADYRGPAGFPSTPEGDNWFKDLHDMGQDPTKRIENGAPYEDSWESWNFSAWENRIIYPQGFNDPEIRRQMKTPEGTPIFWQEIGASFKHMQGLIYTFDKDIHVKKHEYNPLWDDFCGVDFGFTDPFVLLDVQRDGFGNLYVWREYYEPQKTIGDHITTLKARQNPEGYHPTAFADAAEPGAIEDIAINLMPCWGDNEAKDILMGINEMHGMLKGMDGQPHLFVDPSCVHTIREFGNYKWEKPHTDDKNSTNKPGRRNDHTMDALRYLVMHLNVLGGGSRLADFANIQPKPGPEPEEGGTEFRLGSQETIFRMAGAPF